MLSKGSGRKGRGRVTFFTGGVEVYGFEEVVHCQTRGVDSAWLYMFVVVFGSVEKTHMSCQRGLLSIKLTLLINTMSFSYLEHDLTSLKCIRVKDVIAGNMPVRSPFAATISL
jgi:hypothetical protein